MYARAGLPIGAAKNSAMELALRMTLAIVFAWAGIAKLATVGSFAMVLGQHGIPRSLRRPVAVLLPLAEIAVAIVLAIGVAQRATAIAAAA